MATAPALPPPGGEANDSAVASLEDEWAPWPSYRQLTRDEYKDVVDERLRRHYLDLFEFQRNIHLARAVDNWDAMECDIVMVVENFVETVDWDTLDAETQEGLTRWAPRAKEYLGHRIGSRSG